MKKRYCLDLFCGIGGASRGYQLAGFQVIGVDIAEQDDYPFDFFQCDAMEVLRDKRLLASYDLIHASPPCQHDSVLAHFVTKNYPELTEEVCTLLRNQDTPYIIENVMGSSLRSDIVLCGQMFGLKVIRHRKFESNLPLQCNLYHPSCHGLVASGKAITVAGNGGLSSGTFPNCSTVESKQMALGISWSHNSRMLSEAIPPAYTAFLGSQAIRMLV